MYGRSHLTHPATGDEAEGSTRLSKTHYCSHKTNSASSPLPAALNTPSETLEKTVTTGKNRQGLKHRLGPVSTTSRVQKDGDRSQVRLVPTGPGVSPQGGVKDSAHSRGSLLWVTLLFHIRGPLPCGLSPGKYTPRRRPALTLH